MKPIHFWIIWTLLVTGMIAFAQSLEEQFQAADAELNRVYKELRSQLNDAEKTQLKTAQIRWINERDLKANTAISEEFKTKILNDLTNERVNYLKQELKNKSKKKAALSCLGKRWFTALRLTRALPQRGLPPDRNRPR